jgi:hypothetical protein
MNINKGIKVGKENILVRILLKIKGELSTSEIVELIQGVHFDELGGAGHFRATPFNVDDQTPSYILFDKPHTGETASAIYSDGVTSFDIILVSVDAANRDEELKAIGGEWDEFAKKVDGLSWVQLPMGNVARIFTDLI